MMDKTLQLQKVLNDAIDTAEDLNSSLITDDILFKALYQELQYDALGRMLYSNNVSLYTFRSRLNSLLKSPVVGSDMLEKPTIEFSDETLDTLQLAEEYAIRAYQDMIDVSHLLLALLDSRNSMMKDFFKKENINLKKIKKETMQYIFTGEVESMMVTSSSTKKKETPKIILEVCDDLVLMANKGEIDPIIGRQKETEMIIETLARRTKNNVLLVGESGSGKTAIIKGLALKIANEEIPALANKKIYSLKMGALMAGTEYRGKLEGKVQQLVDAFMLSEDNILFIDEAHTLMGTGSSSDNKTDIAQLLKPAMTGRKLQIICATTLKEMKQIESDGAFMRRLNTIKIDEPNDDETIDIVKGLAYKYEEFHNLIIPDETIEAAVKLSSRYITDRHQPDKAIDVLDNAASRLKLLTMTDNGNKAKKIERILDVIEDDISKSNNFDMLCALYEQRKVRRKELEDCLNTQKDVDDLPKEMLSPEHIAQVIEARTGIPVSKLTKSDKEKLLSFEDDMHKAIIGQNQAITAIATALRRSAAGVCDPDRPIASFLFAGSTGTGKTEVAKVLADLRFGSRENIIRIDCAEYSESHTVSKLIGAPKGYVGYGSGGMLTEAIRTKNYAVILFDEVEKGCKELFDLLLGLLDEGKITDSEGLTVNAKNCIIIMTTNMGSALTDNVRSVGFGFNDEAEQEKREYENLKEKTLESIKKQVRPELINRIDDIIVFHQLNKNEQRQICRLMGMKVDKRLANMDMTILATDEAIDFIVEDGYDQAMGARPMMRAIKQHIEEPLSLFILEDKLEAGDHISVELENDEIVFYRIRDGIKTALVETVRA